MSKKWGGWMDGVDGYPLNCYDYWSTWGAKKIKHNFRSFLLVVPILYGVIFKFREAHANTSIGNLEEDTVNKRE